jgi:hypothetical protein
MSNSSSSGNPKQVFTPEQRLALGRVYGFLIEIGRQRLHRIQSAELSNPVSEDSMPGNSTENTINTE